MSSRNRFSVKRFIIVLATAALLVACQKPSLPDVVINDYLSGFLEDPHFRNVQLVVLSQGSAPHPDYQVFCCRIEFELRDEESGSWEGGAIPILAVKVDDSWLPFQVVRMQMEMQSQAERKEEWLTIYHCPASAWH